MTKRRKIQIIKKAINGLQESPLYEFRKKNGYHPVIGEGSLNADIVLVGEAPGETEAKTGRPFAGRAGKVLDSFLHTAGMNRQDVYITNIVNDRPPGNRRPTKKEVELYAPFLIRQLEIIEPQIIVTLGKTATEFALSYFGHKKSTLSFSKIEGSPIGIEVAGKPVKLLPLYHPAYALYQSTMRSHMERSFRKILQIWKQ